MKKILLILFVMGTLVALYAVWQIFGPTVKSPADKYFYITTGAGYRDVLHALKAEQIISNGFFFDKLARQAKYQQNVKAGRYEIKDGSSVYNLIRMLKGGRQAPVRLVINKLRTKEDLAKKIGAAV
jgi:UPF0755 protein